MNSNIKVIPFPDIEGAYIVISAYKSDDANGLKKCMSFFFDGGNNIGAEWEPDYGPITVIYSCAESHPKAQEHWFYPFCTGYGNWSQLAVIDSGLSKAFLDGDYALLFGILKDWTKR